MEEAIKWALKQSVETDLGTRGVVDNGEIDKHLLVMKVREYFNENNIDYETFNYKDLEPYIN